MDESIESQQPLLQVGTNEQSARASFSPFGLGPQETLAIRQRFRGMISVASKVPLKDRSVLSLLYTPGVAAPCLAIAKEPLTAYDYTLRGNIGPMAALPMLEDACILFKTFGGVNAFPICLNTQDIEQTIATSVAIWPTFGGFCLSSIASPRCFTIADHLARAVNIPVLHTEQHATAATILGALSNALKLVGKTREAVRVVINGSGPGGIGTARLLLQAGFQHILVCDRLGILERYRLHNMHWAKLDIARQTNPSNIKGLLSDALRNADVYVGLSSWSTPTPDMVNSMAAQPILFTVALPDPGITPQAALAAGAAVVATAHPNAARPITNALVLPGIFRGALDVRATAITQEMLLAAASAIAGLVPPEQLSPDHLVPSVMDYAVAPRVARTVAEEARRSGVARVEKDPAEIEAQAQATIYEGHRPVRPPSHRYANLQEEALELHRRYQGVLEIQPKIPIRDSITLSSLYLHPGLPEATQQIISRPDAIFDYTGKGNRVGVVTDGSAVLGLGNIGPRAALPVMEGKAILFHTFAGIEAYPICLATQDVDEIVAAVQRIAPAFGGINLEDISAPRCFEVEERLRNTLDLPVVHDDQHGTAIVILAGLMNALRLVQKQKQNVTAVLVGAGAAGIATAKLLLEWGVGTLVLVDRIGILRLGLAGMTPIQEELAACTNPEGRSGGLAEAVEGADIFIGVSAPGILSPDMVRSMAPHAIVFALANPDPEILPDAALEAGARVVATGRSDYPNQVNNSLVFPGLFRGALDVRARQVNGEMKIAAAERLAGLISDRELEGGQIIPQAMNYEVTPALAAAVAQAAMDSGVARQYVDAQLVARYCHDFIYEGRMEPVPSLEETQKKEMRYILTRHEQGASFMADIYGRLTGKAGVCSATLGPGAINLLLGTADATTNSAPLVAISAQVGLDRMYKESHQSVDLVTMFKPVTKWAETVLTSEAVPEMVRKAFKQAQTLRPGAVYLAIPQDIETMPTSPGTHPLPVNIVRDAAPSPSQIARAVTLLQQAKAPLLLAGHGAARAHVQEALVRFSEKLTIPVATTFMGKGVFPDNHPNALGTVGFMLRDYVNFGFAQADVLICVGYELQEFSPAQINPQADKQIIHIHAFPAEVDAHYPVAVGIEGSIALTLDELAQKLSPTSGLTAAGLHIRAVLQEEREQGTHDRSFPLKPQRLVSDIRVAMGASDIVLTDTGATKMWMARLYPTYQPNTCLISNGLSTMGFALPGAIAAKLAFPERRVLAVMGDGSFLMNAQELETARRESISFVVLIWVDESYGLIEWKMDMELGRHSHVAFTNPDFVRFAESFGAKGYRIQSVEELLPTLKRALANDVVSVIACPVDYSENIRLTDKLGKLTEPI